MIVKYKTIKDDHVSVFGSGTDDSYEQEDIEFCCKDMEVQFEEDNFQFSDAEYTKGSIAKVCVKVPSHGDWNAIPIEYCPFCGVKIRCKEVKRVQLKKVLKKTTRTITEYLEVPIK